MSVFVDSSALIAFMGADDKYHNPAMDIWASLAANRESLFTTNYVLIETIALIQRRQGLQAVRALKQDVLPVMTVEWVNESDHQAGADALLAADRRNLSLLDCVSFTVMRRLGIVRCFAFDAHFKNAGFDPLR